jgi:F420-0:gamma-glutamyl ligase
MTKVDVADSLATAAVLEMGEGNEQKPLAVIEGASVEFTERVNRKELLIDIKDDLYRPLFARASKKKR